MILEVMVILMVALIVIKPERWSEIAYFLGRCILRSKLWYQKILTRFQDTLSE